MSSLFTNYFGVQNAKNFEEFVTTTYGNTYITIGKNADWPDGDTPPAPVDTANTFYDYWDNLIGLKRITAADINLVVPRIDWDSTGQTTYVAYNQDLNLFAKANTDQIYYDNKFYVRNSKDQVFKCLANNVTSNTTPTLSTIEPEITIGGQLPENAYIETADGYKWKYLYTIPSGLKQKFFTKEFMPITTDAIVTNNAVDGRLDVFQITTLGAGYNNNSSASSLQVATVSGDGSNANITLKVTSTGLGGANVTDITVINGGYGYTRATISISDPQKQLLTQNATVIPIIGPPGGHGSDIARELGASNLMISVNLTGDEDGVLPVGATEVHGIRQIGILMDPRVSSNNSFASASVYRATTKLSLSQPNHDFAHDDIVYIGNSFETATFTGTVEHYDPDNYYLYLTDIQGSLTTFSSLKSIGGAGANILAIEYPELKKYSGKLLYIEDTSEIRRTLTEITQFKFTLRF